MSSERVYEVMLLPAMEVAERFCTLREAEAWMRTYNEVAGGFPHHLHQILQPQFIFQVEKNARDSA